MEFILHNPYKLNIKAYMSSVMREFQIRLNREPTCYKNAYKIAFTEDAIASIRLTASVSLLFLDRTAWGNLEQV